MLLKQREACAKLQTLNPRLTTLNLSCHRHVTAIRMLAWQQGQNLYKSQLTSPCWDLKFPMPAAAAIRMLAWQQGQNLY